MPDAANPATLEHNLEASLNTPTRKFAHLHQHTQFSLLDGAARVKDLLKWVHKTSESNPTVAMTDHGNMHGAVTFYKYATEMGVKPIIGYEAYVAAGSRFDRTQRKDVDGGYYHLTLLAKDFQGYQNLCKLASIAYLEGYYYKPRIDREVLALHHQGVIALSGCLGAEVPNLILQDRLADAEDRLKWYLDLFKDDYYIEIQNHGLPEQVKVNALLKEWARKYGVGMVATNDGHYVRAEDAFAHETLLAIQTKALMSEEDRFKFPCNDFYVKTRDEMEKALPVADWGEEIFDNTYIIADKCNLELPIGGKRVYQMPALPIPEGRTMDEELRVQVYQGVNARFPQEMTSEVWREYARVSVQHLSDEQRARVQSRIPGLKLETADLETADLETLVLLVAYMGSEWVAQFKGEKYTQYPGLDALEADEAVRQRLAHSLVILRRAEYECGVIIRMGFPDYFLIVADFINWAKDHGIRVGPGRGSGAGSLVAYALRITNLDPLHYGLLFERFLNPDRISMPDFDVDFSDSRRNEVINYVRDKYGDDKVAMIATYGTMSSRACFKDVARVMELPFQDADKLSKLVPVVFGKALSLEKARETVPDIQQMLNENPKAKEVFEIAQSLEGLTRHSSVHASGVVIGRERLDNLVPLMRDNSGEGVVCQFDMSSVEDIGLIKMDFLGLRTLSFLEEAMRIVKESKGVSLEPDDFPIDDAKTYELIARGETKGVFQLEGGGITDAARKLKPRRIEDVNALSALYRPGPMENIPTYIERHHGREAVNYNEFPTCEQFLEPILRETYGIPVYQEQIMQIASAVAGYSLGQSDLLRRCVAKGTLVLEADTGRRVPIESVTPGMQVLSLGPDHRLVRVPVYEVMCNGAMRTYRVRTRAGREICLTRDHPLLTVSGWKHLCDLRVGDAIAVPTVLPVHGSQSPDAARVKLIAYLISDGNTLQNGKPTAFFYNSDEAVLADYEAAACEFGVKTTRYVHAGTGVTTITARGEVRGQNALTALVVATKLDRLAFEKRIPLEVFGYDERSLRLFVGRLWATDGSIEKTRISFSSASRELIQDIGHLLLRFGINSIRRHGKTTHRDRFELVITDQSDIERFHQAFVSTLVGAKSARLEALATLARGRVRNHSIYDVPADVGFAIKNAKTASGRSWREAGHLVGVDGSRLSSGLNLKTPSRSLSRHRVTALAEAFSSEHLRLLADNDVLWDEILEIEDAGEVEVFDLAVPPFANFVAADVIVHNSMGKKKMEEMIKERAKFLEGSKKTNNIPEGEANALFDLLEKFANYGFNKCLIGATEVYAADGSLHTMQGLFEQQHLPELPSLEEGFQFGHGSVTAVMENGVKPVFRLTTSLGKHLTATGNHPLLTLNGWRNLEDLRPGDRIAAPARLPIDGNATWPKHQLVMLGWILSEGNTCHPCGAYVYTKDRASLEDVLEAAQAFERTQATVKLRPDRNDVFDVYLGTGKRGMPGRSGVRVWLESLGVVGQNATAKFFPAEVFTLCNADLAVLLGRFWSGDGFVSGVGSNSTPYLATSSERMARQVQHLLLRLGMVSRFRRKLFKYKEGRVGYTVHLLGRRSLEVFADVIVPHLVGRDQQTALLRQFLAETPADRETIHTLPPEIKLWVADAKNRSGKTWLEVEADTGVCVKELYGQPKAHKKGFRRHTIRTLAAYFKDARLANACSDDLYWETVVRVDPAGEAMTYDLEVAGTHNFVANDLVVHNSHSAAYAFISFQTAFIKAHYPVEFMAALLTVERRDSDKVAEYINDARQIKLENGSRMAVLPPDISLSGPDFRVVGEKILFGLLAVKNLGDGAVAEILEERNRNGAFKSLADFCSRTRAAGLNRRALETLVKAGAFDAFGSRESLLESVEEALNYAAGQAQMASQGMDSLFGMATVAPEPKLKLVPPPVDELEVRARAIKLLKDEKDAVGLYITGHPLEHYPGMLEAASCKTNAVEAWFHTSTAPVGFRGRKRAMLAGTISGIQRKPTKSGGMMARFNLTDDAGTIELVAFSRAYDKINAKLSEDAPALVIVEIEPDGEGVRVTAEDVVLYEQAQKEPKILFLEVGLEDIATAQLEQLDAILQEQEGTPNIPIRLRVTGPGGYEVWDLDHRATPATPELLARECPWLRSSLGINGDAVLAKLASAPKPWEQRQQQPRAMN